MKTTIDCASLLLSLLLAASASGCTGTDGSSGRPAAPAEGQPAAGAAPPPESAPPAPPPPSPDPLPPPAASDAPPAGSAAPPAAGAPDEHPPALVGYWGACQGTTFATYQLREDGSAVSGLSHRPGYGCGGGAPLPPASEPDQVCDCTWRVAGESASPSAGEPWLFYLTCDGVSGAVTIVSFDETSLTLRGGDGASATYARLN
jgi:hypothetical protein